MKDPNIDRAWLFNPANSLDACAAYIKSNHDLRSTDWDPIYAACAYNAGGLYENKGEAQPLEAATVCAGTSKHRFVGHLAKRNQHKC
jgi:hypothetical protein